MSTDTATSSTPKKLVVTGGAGYVGSVCTARLVEAGHEVTVVDDLSTGHADAVPDGVRFVEGDAAEVAETLLAEGFDGLLHFAAKSLVGESMQDPAKYWQGNVVTSLRLLAADPGAPRRRAVLVAELPEDRVTGGGDPDARGAVRVTGPVPLKRIVAGHVDDPDAVPDVAAAVEALPAADAGDDDAAFTVDGAEGHELMWYATQELQFLE